MKKLAYIAGKYTDKSFYFVQRNIDLARVFAQEIALRGALPVTPHLLSAHFDGIQDYPFWLESTLELMRRCDVVFMLPNWETSNGAKGELVEAVRLGIPVFYANDLIARGGHMQPMASDFFQLEAWLNANALLQT